MLFALHMTQSNDLNLRVTRLENDNIDIKVAVSALIETVTLHQRNFETMQRNFDRMQGNIEAMQAEIRGIQMENRRLIERVFHEPDDEDV